MDNSTAWRAMSSVLTDIPRVVHPDDVYSEAVHVAGRHLHYVCGMCCHETVAKKTKTGKEQEGSFCFQRFMREEVLVGQQCQVPRWILHVCRRKIRTKY